MPPERHTRRLSVPPFRDAPALFHPGEASAKRGHGTRQNPAIFDVPGYVTSCLFSLFTERRFLARTRKMFSSIRKISFTKSQWRELSLGASPPLFPELRCQVATQGHGQCRPASWRRCSSTSIAVSPGRSASRWTWLSLISVVAPVAQIRKIMPPRCHGLGIGQVWISLS